MQWGHRLGIRLHGRIARVNATGAPADDDGFSIIETVMALGVVFTVVLGLMASLNTGIRGLLTGRQRTGAVAVAKEVIEEARSQPYADLGHAVATDTTLASDPRIAGTSPNYTYQPDGAPAPEVLVASATPHFPVHEWTDTRDGSVFYVRVYVTWVDLTTGDDHKRLTVEVEYTPDQYQSSAVPNVVRLSTFVSVGGQSAVAPGATFPTADVGGVIDVSAGTLTMSGVVGDVTVTSGEVMLPSVHDDFDGQILRTAHGGADASRSALTVASGSVTGPEVDGATARCTGPSLATKADNDGGTPAPVHQVSGPSSHSGCTISASNGGVTAVAAVLGTTGSATSRATVESCSTCSPFVGDGDGLMYVTGQAEPPGSVSVTYGAGILSGALLSMSGSVAGAEGTLDADPVTDDQLVTAAGRLRLPGVDLLTMSPAPTGYAGAVKISAVDISATAQAGPTASAPAVSSGTVTVDVFETDELGLGSYRTVTVTPGVALETTAHASFGVTDLLGVLSEVTIDTTIRAGGKSTTCSPSCSSIEEASAVLENWLVVEVHFRAVELGVTVADVVFELDFGRVSSQARYVP